MRFLVYSPLSGSEIATSLGTPDYSYYFVMRRFLPVLEEFGEVLLLEHPPSEDDVLERVAAGPCVFLSFTPPHKLAEIRGCPAIPVFAWEYDTIPDETFTNPRDNWVHCLQQAGAAITHSRFAADVVRRQLGENYPVTSIPAPVWDACASIRAQRAAHPPGGLEGLELSCTVIDSNDYEISNIFVLPKAGSSVSEERPLVPLWDGDPREYRLADDDSSLVLIGFNEPEDWGVWSKSGHPWIILDRTISGPVELELSVIGYGPFVGKSLQLELGSATASVILSDAVTTHRLTLQADATSNFLTFRGVEKRAEGMKDPRDIGFGISGIKISLPHGAAADPGAEVVVDLSDDSLRAEGFHEVESAGGRWTFSSQCELSLPESVQGDIQVAVSLFHNLHNTGRDLLFRLGDQACEVKLEEGQGLIEFSMKGLPATDAIRIENIGYGDSGSDSDSRQLGLGVSSVTVTTLPTSQLSLPDEQPAARILPRLSRKQKGVLYTTVLNPSDDRKNWTDIVTAFVYAFRDREDVSLLVKITNHDLPRFFEDIFTFFKQLHPFRCRLVFAHGYLDDEEYDALVANSHFVVNASRGEGQCLPLMEFMSSGVPAIAPTNTAMAEYVDDSNAFTVTSTKELMFWPQDPREVFRTHWHRINWQSLNQAFVDSEKMLRRSPRKYRRMGKAAVTALERYCSAAVFRERFREFLDFLDNDGAG
jgi:glycosyltransferase involved in cell wall biosynthesis